MVRRIVITALFLACIPASRAEESKTDLPRLSVTAGAGSGYLMARDNKVPFRVNAGLEYFFKKLRHISVGYRFTLPVSTDQVSVTGGAQTLHRMVHYFPHVRCFLFGRDFALGGLSINLAPGIGVQQMGGMMAGLGAGPYSSIAAMGSLEYNIEVEDRIHLGIEAAGEYLAPVRGALPRTLIWTASANLHLFFSVGGFGEN